MKRCSTSLTWKEANKNAKIPFFTWKDTKKSQNPTTCFVEVPVEKQVVSVHNGKNTTEDNWAKSTKMTNAIIV